MTNFFAYFTVGGDFSPGFTFGMSKMNNFFQVIYFCRNLYCIGLRSRYVFYFRRRRMDWCQRLGDKIVGYLKKTWKKPILIRFRIADLEKPIGRRR